MIKANDAREIKKLRLGESFRTAVEAPVHFNLAQDIYFIILVFIAAALASRLGSTDTLSNASFVLAGWLALREFNQSDRPP